MMNAARRITLMPCHTCRASGTTYVERGSGQAAPQTCLGCWGVGLLGVRWGQSPRDEVLHLFLLDNIELSEGLCQHTVTADMVEWDVDKGPRCPRCAVLLGMALTEVHGGRDRWVWTG